MLIAAATKIAQDERAQRAAKSLWDNGVEAWGKRQNDRAAPAEVPGLQSGAVTEAPVPKQRPGWRAGIERRMGFRDGQSGDLIQFTYTDEHGLICERPVGNWRCEGGQLTGYCLNRKQDKSFAVPQIGEWEVFPVQAKG
ncbi:hypothetical protein PK98_14835 [Croceibacterium mercuriale]|uniref:Uncharacterized protein n=2 Tax=Croceibacterium mercuriale TaxID=1572751 RepID=A0A0B2BS94_9SPHN|nr:hypothetical protein PK98_14835 [Croceibacterium mercuriale]